MMLLDLEDLSDLEEVLTPEERFLPVREPVRELKAFELELAMWAIEGKMPYWHIREFFHRMELRKALPENNRPVNLDFARAVMSMAFLHSKPEKAPAFVDPYPMQPYDMAGRILAELTSWFTPTEQAVIACEVSRRYAID